jgi:hypothetical protein
MSLEKMKSYKIVLVLFLALFVLIERVLRYIVLTIPKLAIMGTRRALEGKKAPVSKKPAKKKSTRKAVTGRNPVDLSQ